MSDVVLVDLNDRIATVTLNRPEMRNALNADLHHALLTAMLALDADNEVDAVIVTGADPAFCAGVDLKELGSSNGRGGHDPMGGALVPPCPVPPMVKPLIGAINGAAVTGGLELALRCDFLIASDRARFADTHARVGVMPGWGLSVLLPQAVGIRKAREMSVTGNFIGAEEARAFGLVNHVIPHKELLATAKRMASDIVESDQASVRRMLATYDEVASTTAAEGMRIEAQVANVWPGNAFDPEEIARRRARVIERGRRQTT